MTRKLRSCTAGQIMKFAFKAGMYTSWNFRVTARRPPPSATVIKVKKHARPVAKSVHYPVLLPYLCKTLTDGSKHKLITSNSFQHWEHPGLLRQGERPRQKGEPMELNWRHHEAVSHKAGQPLEVKWRWQLQRSGYQFRWGEWILLVQLVYLNRNKVIFSHSSGLP